MIVPALLVVIALAGLGTAVALDREHRVDPAPATGAGSLATPVLSVRRAPAVLAAPIAERRLRADLAALAATLPPDSCLTVRDLTGVTVFDHQGDRPLRPASNQKLLTAATVLEVLPVDARFRTRVVTTAPVTGGVLEGDLVLVGGGDPNLATADYAARYRNQPQLFTDVDRLARSIAETGITRVRGAVLGDESRYDAVRSVPGWPDRYLTAHDVGPLSALSVNDGFEAYPSSTGANDAAVPAADPAAHAARVLQERLAAVGVVVEGQPGRTTAPAGAREVAAVESPTVADVVAAMLRESDNQTAELLMKELGRTTGYPSTAGGAAVVAATLDRAAPADGSGLSLDDRATCQELLTVFDRPETGAAIDDGLAVAGQSGTLTRRFVDTPLAGRLRAKSGSLNTVRSLSGAVEDDDGVLRFASILTVPDPGPLPSSADGAHQRLGEILLAYPRLADPAALAPLVAPEP